jgi:hypothetical protein
MWPFKKVPTKPPDMPQTSMTWDAEYESPDSLVRQILIRLKAQYDNGHAICFQHIAAFKAGDRVLVFVVANGLPVTLEDEFELFPSDGLVTKLRLLRT